MRETDPISCVEPKRCVFVSGKVSCVNVGIYEITKALRPIEVRVSVDDQFIKSETGIDVKDGRNADLLQSLEESAFIDIRCVDDRIMLKRKPNLGIQDCYTLKEAIDTSWGGDKMTMETKDLDNTYRGVENDAERLAQDGEVGFLSLGESSIFFKRLQGAPASGYIKDLWHSVDVPKGDSLQDELVKRRILTPAEVKERAARIKKERDKKKMESDRATAAKQMRKMAVIRKVTNTHLQLPRYTEEM